jgi:NADH-quinone oxidoreductase subunit N
MKVLIATSLLGIFAMISELIGLKKWIGAIVILGLIAIMGLNVYDWNTTQIFYGMMEQNSFSAVCTSILLGITLLWFILSRDYYSDERNGNLSDQAALILFATVGGLVLVSFKNLTMLFLGIEIMSIPMYILAGSHKKELSSNESSLKYFIMGSFATGLLLFGIALLYGATGSFDMIEISRGLMGAFMNPSVLYLSVAGILFVLMGFAFKVSAAPFHFWTPDVYEGAPTIISSFMATFIKTAAFIAFFRLFAFSFSSIMNAWSIQVLFMAALTILAGNILAIRQTNLKRTLAYSGIAQAGYMLLTILIQTQDTLMALVIYTTAYSIATLVAFTVLYHVQKVKNDFSFEAFRSLGKENPGLAVVLSIAMLSLAGIPPTVGFFAKFFLFKSILAANPGFIWVVLFAIAGSLISLYYYFKVIMSMFGGEGHSVKIEMNMGVKIALYLITSLLIVLGLMPDLLLQLATLTRQ